MCIGVTRVSDTDACNVVRIEIRCVGLYNLTSYSRPNEFRLCS
ncbi:hypothetical protein A2U01_0115247, partial [Trifolium medium]|nr:hypothetical protein [Trifolium medium]